MTIPGKEAREFEYEFDQEKITLGREQDNDIQVPLSTVSRNHATLSLEEGEWYIEDLRSTHGTKHNGRPLGKGGKKLLRSGDTIEVVHFKITFRNVGQSLSEDYSVEKTEALAQRMVKEVLATIGDESEVPILRVMNGPDEGARYQLTSDKSEVVIGRGNDCDFQINDANISRRHALVKRDWQDITINDLGSKNGVVVNENKIDKARSLRDADEILLGSVRLTFIDPSAKFIGELEGIPAFEKPTEHDESIIEEAAPEAEVAPEEEAPLPPPAEEEALAPPLDVAPPAFEEEPSFYDDKGPKGALPLPKKGGLGALEIAMIAALAMLVIVLVIGVFLFVL